MRTRSLVPYLSPTPSIIVETSTHQIKTEELTWHEDNMSRQSGWDMQFTSRFLNVNLPSQLAGHCKDCQGAAFFWQGHHPWILRACFCFVFFSGFLLQFSSIFLISPSCSYDQLWLLQNPHSPCAHRNPVGLQGDCSRLALHHMISDVFWSELMERGKHGTLLVEVRAMSSPTNLRQKLSYLAESSWELHVESIIVHSDFLTILYLASVGLGF